MEGELGTWATLLWGIHSDSTERAKVKSKQNKLPDPMTTLAPARRNRAKPESSATKPVAEVVANHPFLEGMKAEHIAKLQESAMRIRYNENEIIFREGELANRFYLIEEGSVAVESYSELEPLVSLETIEAGDVLGWSWLYPPYRWHFDARVVEPTTAIFFYGTRLRQQCEEDPDFGYEMMKRMTAVVIRRLQVARKRLIEAAH